MPKEIKRIIIELIIAVICFILIYLISKYDRKKNGLENYKPRYQELIQIPVNKGIKNELRTYAKLKGYKNEVEYVTKLIADEIEKDRNKLQ
ncbi:hypothetical protein [uncultured Eubacterium sp.]|uniref:hypothetical protein n=1 Tax=uncultured Eubacterium sp. TaxID=165185 RepID=UPI002582DD7D|nr:hypothetical protein [uncultured Eubacterium sp.]